MNTRRGSECDTSECYALDFWETLISVLTLVIIFRWLKDITLVSYVQPETVELRPSTKNLRYKLIQTLISGKFFRLRLIGPTSVRYVKYFPEEISQTGTLSKQSIVA